MATDLFQSREVLHPHERKKLPEVQNMDEIGMSLSYKVLLVNPAPDAKEVVGKLKATAAR